jgi:sulfotransferase family protein
MFGPAIRHMQVRYFIDHDPDYRKTTFVTGMGRSGTTWLAELLNFRNGYRFIFEPFDPHRVALAASFLDHQYLRPDDDRRIYLAPATAIVTGYIREHFVDQHNRKLICGRRIVKEVRGNLILRWLYRHFSGMPLVLIVRHPLAVAASRLATDEDVDLQAAFLDQPQLVEDHLQPFINTMRSCGSPFERHIAAWCIENGVPLAQFAPGELCVVSYERLCVEPEETLREVFAHVGRPFDRRVLDGMSRPSRTALAPDQLTQDWKAGGGRVVAAWRDRLSPAQIQRGLEIIEAFAMSGLYGEEPVPGPPRSWLPFRLGRGSASLKGERATSEA